MRPPSRRTVLLLCLLCLVAVAVASSDSSLVDSNGEPVSDDDGSFDSDPILKFRPAFARSLPVQILMTGIVLTLVAVLFLHLLFTAQYHWPIAQTNFVLQISGVSTLLISLIATLHIILGAAGKESQQWPYMLSYIAVNVPPVEDVDIQDWSMAERATWLIMNATTSVLVQITHIQFLTLLYPSRLEGRLIFFLLAPLAVMSATMQLVPIQASVAVDTVASAIRNVCNATLSLIFTVALLIWGLLINRKSAWRTDGGTFAFGAGAITLALASTALNFMYIKTTEEYEWMSGLMWAVVLWQSFLGWWWWVGAGMGVGEVEELLRRHEKRERKRRERRERRREQREKAKMMWRGVTDAFNKRRSASLDEDEEEILEPEPDADVADSATLAAPASTASTSSESQRTSPLLNTRAGRFVHHWFQLLRHAHLTAARRQAVERRMQQQEAQPGWGLGSYGADREHRRDETSEDEGEAYEMRGPGDEEYERGRRMDEGTPPRKPPPSAQVPSTSMWWWGPLKRWRLKDSTVY